MSYLTVDSDKPFKLGPITDYKTYVKGNMKHSDDLYEAILEFKKMKELISGAISNYRYNNSNSVAVSKSVDQALEDAEKELLVFYAEAIFKENSKLSEQPKPD